ncbi:MAG: PEP-CTERM sorting domain-containing protein [Gemmatimonadaceae bacterium]
MKRLAEALVLVVIAAAPAYAGRIPPVTVVPEPGTIVMLATGLGIVGAGAWWRNRRR